MPPALIGGLVLIVMLIGFTVMQHAFAGGAFAQQGLVNDTERRALALSGAGDIVFDWDVVSDRIFVSPEVEHQLGLKRGSLEGPASAWLDVIHPFDRDRYRAALDAVIEQRRGRLTQDFRLRSASGPASLVPPQGAPGDRLRRRGHPHRRHARRRHRRKTAEERLLHDAVHDNLTSLPNRQLFYDRLEAGAHLREPGRRPAPDRGRDRPRQVQAGERIRSAIPRATRSCSRSPAASAASSSRRIRWRGSPATSSPSSFSRSGSPTASSPSPT